MGRRAYSDETKAAVMAALLAGQAITLIAKEYKIPEGTVGRWKSEASKIKRERIGELLLDYVTASLQALTVQAQVFGDAKWIRKQKASEVAVLHGISADKTTRILEALASPSEEDDTTIPGVVEEGDA